MVCPAGASLCTSDGGTAYCSLSEASCIEPTSPPAVPSEPVAPVLALIGPPEVGVLQGTPYGACTDDVPVGMHCDQGASVHSAVEGDVSWTVAACADHFLFWQYGLAGCSIDTSVAGNYQLAFFVMHGERRIEVQRTLWVLETCPGTMLRYLKCRRSSLL